MQNKYPPRPRWNHNIVKHAVAREYVGDVRNWAELHGVTDIEASDREYLVAVTMALQESPDAYQAGRYLDDFFEWPVTHELIKIFDAAFIRQHTATHKFVIEWVVENNVRFPAKKGEGVRFRIGDAEIGGTVLEILRQEAKAVVRVNGNGKNIVVNAEEVLQVTSPSAVAVQKPVKQDGPPEIA